MEGRNRSLGTIEQADLTSKTPASLAVSLRFDSRFLPLRSSSPNAKSRFMPLKGSIICLGAFLNGEYDSCRHLTHRTIALHVALTTQCLQRGDSYRGSWTRQTSGVARKRLPGSRLHCDTQGA
jgi:hypothetical protein